MTRRELVQLAAVVPAASAASAAQTATPPPIPANPEEERKAAQAQFKSAAGQIANVKLPDTTEPAVHFKA